MQVVFENGKRFNTRRLVLVDQNANTKKKLINRIIHFKLFFIQYSILQP